MLIEITTTAYNASDLGYLLYKNPSNVFERELPYGVVRVFYPEANDDRCTAVLWLDVDQVGLVRGGNQDRFALSQYVNDRPYVASSFVSVAIGTAFATAMTGRSKDRPERALEKWPLTIMLPAVDCDAGADFIKGIFEPLGYTVNLLPLALDSNFPEWGTSTLYHVTLSANVRIADALTHLYVLLPVLDNQKHYTFGEDEVTKLLDNAKEWLSAHPQRNVITKRYLRYRRKYIEDAEAALDRLTSINQETPSDGDVSVELEQHKEDILEQPLRLHDQRLTAVAELLSSGPHGNSKVIDLGCGDGRLMALLAMNPNWKKITGMDVVISSLKRAARRLHLDRDQSNTRVSLLHGSLLYRDERLMGYDAAALVEVIEHIELERLEFVERVVFGYAKPGRVVVTTPNAEYNIHWPTLPAGKFRHSDHRFEWTRAEFTVWTQRIVSTYGYTVEISGIGEPDGDLGPPSQVAVFDRVLV